MAIAKVPVRVQKLFAVALVLKVLSSGLGWWVGDPWFLGCLLPLAIMAGYMILGLRRDPTDVSNEKFADSCYYLGFIFTITSIVFSLFDLPQIGARLQDISLRFGAAMVSTVLGLAVRVYLVGFREDDATKVAEQSALAAAERLREQLFMLLEKMRDFEAKVDLAATSSVERVKEQVDKMSKDHAERLGSLSAQLLQRNRELADESIRAVQAGEARLADALDASASKLDKLTANLTDRTHAVALNAIKAIGAGGASLSAALDEQGRRIATFCSDLLEQNREAAHTSLDEVRQGASELSRSLESLAQTLGKSLSAVEKKLDAYADGLTERLGNMTFPDDLFVSQLQQPIDALRKASLDLAGKIEDSGRAAAAFPEVLAQAANAINGSKQQAADTLADVVNLAHQQKAVLEAAKGQVKTYQDLSDALIRLEKILTGVAAKIEENQNTVKELLTRTGDLSDDSRLTRQQLGAAISDFGDRIVRTGEGTRGSLGKLLEMHAGAALGSERQTGLLEQLVAVSTRIASAHELNARAAPASSVTSLPSGLTPPEADGLVKAAQASLVIPVIDRVGPVDTDNITSPAHVGDAAAAGPAVA